MPEPLPEDLDPEDFWVCEKHDRWCALGYPCGACHEEWRAANPKRVREIQRLVNRSLPEHLRSKI